mmetsp:Transcript_28590/g.47601  ORF Transcript_28590/g.47601 Transcript_28590/m.47601 type:complete len:309 (+) Transcript_28590:113-1039(+)
MPETDPNLEAALGDTERLIVKQKADLLEAAVQAAANAVDLSGLGSFGEQANEYLIYTDEGGDGKQKFKVVETSEYCGFTGRCCCRPNHALTLHLFEPEVSTTSEVMYMDRPCKCGQCCACCDICQQEMRVYQGDLKSDNEPNPNHQIGHIKMPAMGGGFSPTLNVMDREGAEPFATIKANAFCCIGGMCCDHTFEVTDANGNYMGKIVKEKPEGLSQVAKELGTDADNFTIYVPKDMDVQKKANLLAALHLIDYWLFEDEGDFNCDVVNQRCECKICDLYCFGCVCPCKCSCGGGGDGDDGDEGGEES